MQPAADFSFFDLVPELERAVIVDVGAALTSKPPFYQTLLDRGRARIFGFEPDPESFERLCALKSPFAQYFPYVLGDGADAIFHQTTFRYTASLFKPNEKLTRRFTNISNYLQVSRSQSVRTHRLDDVVQSPHIDFLKVDVQGGELKVLEGAPRLLATVLIAEIEVEFLPLYDGQPLFADIDKHMRDAGFQFHTFLGHGSLFYKPVKDRGKALAGLNQLAYSDAVYIRDLDAAEQLPRNRLLALVGILHDFYRSWDLCIHLLQHLAHQGDSALLDAYVAKLGLK